MDLGNAGEAEQLIGETSAATRVVLLSGTIAAPSRSRRRVSLLSRAAPSTPPIGPTSSDTETSAGSGSFDRSGIAFEHRDPALEPERGDLGPCLAHRLGHEIERVDVPRPLLDADPREDRVLSGADVDDDLVAHRVAIARR